jgi:hypothetical protein
LVHGAFQEPTQRKARYLAFGVSAFAQVRLNCVAAMGSILHMGVPDGMSLAEWKISKRRSLAKLRGGAQQPHETWAFA